MIRSRLGWPCFFVNFLSNISFILHHPYSCNLVRLFAIPGHKNTLEQNDFLKVSNLIKFCEIITCSFLWAFVESENDGDSEKVNARERKVYSYLKKKGTYDQFHKKCSQISCSIFF